MAFNLRCKSGKLTVEDMVEEETLDTLELMLFGRLMDVIPKLGHNLLRAEALLQVPVQKLWQLENTPSRVASEVGRERASRDFPPHLRLIVGIRVLLLPPRPSRGPPWPSRCRAAACRGSCARFGGFVSCPCTY